jgi:tRNA 2-thiocytidine biosynthesis protein TtcA
MQNVKPSHLLDASLFDFKHIQLGTVVEDGDVVFDQDE